MNEPPRKRRKTASPNASEAASSPLKKPLRRPSFASPTKASLARFNPNLLQTGREALIQRGKQARAFIFGGSAEQTAGTGNTQNEADPTIAAAGRGSSLEEERRATVSEVARRNTRESTSVSQEEEEPELPQTSPQALEQDTPRRGMLFSSPSKRPPRKATGVHSSLKARPGVSSETRIQPVNGADARGEGTETGAAKKKEPPDPELESKKREKEKLLRELADLQNDVEQCVDKVKWLHSRSPSQELDPGDRDDLISFINKMTNSEALERDKTEPTISNLLCSFLPYAAQAIHQPQNRDDAEDIVPSHHPIDLDDPLPYLQMFTSLQFTPRMSLPDLEGLDNESRNSYQRLSIDIIGPQKLLTGSVEATIDTMSHRIVNLDVPRLSAWAEKELGTFMREKAKQKNLSCACWAMDSYWDLTKKRAEYWRKCETAFAHLIPGRRNVGNENSNQAMDGDASKNMTRKDLLRHLGRDVLVLEDKHVLLKISWRIQFDWTGEAESIVQVEPAYPRVWAEADTSRSLNTIPQTFQSLVEAHGVFAATKIMVALLFAKE
ncbi:uncharacterized protein EI97DRAFT_497022 [Westerdykella ornata]|uniref:Uncharacterized protein n=1 Tax=Westerdykella ornata TaxID=318751 RepID=A0A6A6J9B1_WESOR|nr:uncharacterized protein EI97DRAFT_497022 [Westerdykella ornata]KAF2271809.1 hypothetical protein EI97DRAFT_497022 [Westerdykella ornata]